MAIQWKRFLPVVSLFLMAGCSSISGIVIGLSTSVSSDLSLQTAVSEGPSIAAIAATESDRKADVATLLDQVDALATGGDFVAALSLADEAAELAPANPEVHWMRGRLLYRLNDFVAALAAYDQAIQAGMDWSYGYLTLSSVYQAMGDTGAEIAALTQAIDLARPHGEESIDLLVAESLERRSELWTQAGDLEAAIDDLEDALSLNPWHYDNYAVLGNLRHRLVSRQAAFTENPTTLLADLNERLSNDPADAQARLKRGQNTLQLAIIDGDSSNLNAAYQDFTLALSLDPGLAEAYHGRALAAWLASGAGEDMSDMDVDEILALAEFGVTVNFQARDAAVTITGGTVTMTDTQTGEVMVQSVDEWRVAQAEMPLSEGATSDAALADLEMAISLAPDLVAARHDRGVMRLRAWLEDGLFTLLTGDAPAVDEALAAAVSDLDFAAQRLPDWTVARFNQGLARFFQMVSLFQVAMSEDGDEETEEALLEAYDVVIADASWLIEQDPTSGWAYFMRFMTVNFMQDVMPEMDETLAASMETDAIRMFELVPDLNTDDAVFQFAYQARVSLQVAPPPLLSSGALEGVLEADDYYPFYVNDAFGLRLRVPERTFDSIVADTAINGNLMVRMSGSLGRFDMLVIQPLMGDRSLDEWLDDTLLEATPDGVIVKGSPLQTSYGPATRYEYIGEIPGVLAILPIGEYVYSFEYVPGPYADYGSTPGLVLKSFIEGLSFE